MAIYNKRNSVEVANQVRVAKTWFQRFRGLLGRSSLGEGEALIITQCSAVHMFFMRFPIDIVFCSKTLSVLAVEENLRPWRMSRMVFGCKQVIELPVGSILKADIRVGDELELR